MALPTFKSEVPWTCQTWSKTDLYHHVTEKSQYHWSATLSYSLPYSCESLPGNHGTSVVISHVLGRLTANSCHGNLHEDVTVTMYSSSLSYQTVSFYCKLIQLHCHFTFPEIDARMGWVPCSAESSTISFPILLGPVCQMAQISRVSRLTRAQLLPKSLDTTDLNPPG